MDRRETPVRSAPIPSSKSLALPPFWPSDPELWFAVAEAQFVAKSITSEKAMFYHVVSCISSDVAAEVRDLVLEPPVERAFDALKQRLIQRAPSLEQHRLQEALSSEELSERTPSDILRRLRQLLGTRARPGNDSLLRDAFVRRLPAAVRDVLSSAGDMSLDVMAQLADKVAEVANASPPPSAVSADVSAEVHRLRGQVSKLTKLVEALTVRRRRVRSKSPHSVSPAAASSRKQQQAKECWYHRRYGDQASKCVSPCVRKAKTPPQR